MSYTALAERTTRLLTSRYLVALTAVGVLTLIGQGVIQWALLTQSHDARVINLAGRQRMLSQQLAKNLLSLDHLSPEAAERVRDETRQVLLLWQRTQRGLIAGDAGLDLPRNRSSAVAERARALEPAYTAFAAQVTRQLEGPRQVAELLADQAAYLTGQEALVWQFDHESSQRVRTLQVLEAFLFLLLVAVLVAEGLLVFRPTAARIHASLLAQGRAERRALEEHLSEAAGRLQRRIGQDLHDGLGQELTGISFQAKALANRLKSHDTSPQAAEITTALQAAIAQTRSLSRLLNPPAAEAESLGAAMRDLAENTARAYGIACECAWNDDLPLPPTDDQSPPGVHLYRIAQEAISNACRHGRAKRLILLGRLEGRQALVEIEDDGCGFDPPPGEGPGMGLRSMAYRADRLGARLSIERQDGGGMRIRVSWPTPAPTASGQAGAGSTLPAP